MNHGSVSRRRAGADDGFTLIEVVVSLVLLGIVATAALYFFIQGTQTTSYLQRSQNAVAVANEAMETAYAINPQNNAATGVSNLLAGRSQTAVQAAWTSMTALGVSGASDTYPAWDTTAPLPAVALPITRSIQHSGEAYTITTLVGICYRASNVVSTNQACTKLVGVPAAPADTATPAGMVRMLRVLVVVTWADRQCNGTCRYQLSGLVDRSNDLKWNQVVTPVAVDDYESFTWSESRAINVLNNDLLGPVTSNPVTLLSSPAAGTATVASNGVVTYTAAANGSGKYPFTYRIKNAQGAQSAPATIEITLPPSVTNDTVRVPSGTSTPIAVTANDKGSPAVVTITSGPSNGTAVVSGLNVVYTPSVSSGGDSFRYKYTDGSSQETLEATVTVLIDRIEVQDRFIQLNQRTGAADAWADLTALLFSGNTNTTGWKINFSGAAPTGMGTLQTGTVTYAGPTATGSTARFNPAQNWAGEYTIGYSLTNADGTVSPVKNLTIRVVAVAPATPVAVADTWGRLGDDNVTIPLSILANDTPNTVSAGGQYEIVLGALPATCGTWNHTPAELASGVVKVRTRDLPGNDKSPQTCTFSYSIRGKAPWTAVTSATVNATFGWNNP